MIALRLGWRNLWRNRRRSLITISAFATAYALLIANIGLMEGVSRQMLRNGTELLLGHLQVHHRDYLPDRRLYDNLQFHSDAELESFCARLETGTQGVEAVTRRLYGFGLVSTGEHSAGVQLLGVDPIRELTFSRLLRPLKAGRDLAPTETREVILGDTLAQELVADLGSEVAIVTQAADGTLGNDLFRVVGILDTGLSYVDRALAVTAIHDLRVLLALPPHTVHEVAVRLDDPVRADAVAAAWNTGDLLPAAAEATPWGELAPRLRDHVALAGAVNGFVILLVALFAAFGILNTMLMAVFERTREIGMLLALGMRPATIVCCVMAESCCLVVLGLIAGLGLGSILMLYLSAYGWDLSAWAAELSLLNTRLDPVLYAAWHWPRVGWAALGLGISAVVAALIPARRAVRLDPVDALNAPVGDLG